MSVGGLEEEYDYNYHAVEGSGDFLFGKYRQKISVLYLTFYFFFSIEG